MPLYPRNTPHILLQNKGNSEPFVGRGGGQSKSFAPRDRETHAAALRAAIQIALSEAERRLAGRRPDAATGKPGFYLEIEVPAERRAALDSLGNRPKGVELVAVREPASPGDPIIAAVFVPESARDYYLDKVEAYALPPEGNQRPANQALVEAIEDVRIAEVASVFTDPADHFPDHDRAVWWEVWLRKGTHARFLTTATALGVRVQGHAVLEFREREVMLAYARPSQLGEVLDHTDAIAEIRLASETPAIFMRMNGGEQQAWSDDLLRRIVAPDENAPAVCLLDTGVNRGHTLIAPALDANDVHTYDPNWGANDTRRHGTRMAGTALFGDLSITLQATTPVQLRHRLESVKIFPPESATPHDRELYGWVTQESVARVEITAAHRRRVVALAITTDDDSLGRPSQWSAKIDDLAFDPSHRRLFFVASGNIRDDIVRSDYLDRNDVSPVDDPGQAWNALTIGAYTDRANITDPAFASHYEPFAPSGDLSPTCRTSVAWSSGWPIKPDVVLEGGNLAAAGTSPGEAIDDLQLLTTHAAPLTRPFDTFGETSAATAAGAGLGASLIAARPHLWEETVRALIVHSAEWTDAMTAHVADPSRKGDWRLVLRRYGFGVPDLERALLSARNDVTLIAQDELQPFYRPRQSRKSPDKPNSSVLMKEMNVHALPWPREELLKLQEAEARCRITLSYFIEPNPGERGWTRKHRYASHGLRFAFKGAEETLVEFRARINAAIENEELGQTEGGGGDHWLLGPRQRNVGSLHADIWTGTAAELATRDAIAVYPIGGWWKEKAYLQRFEERVRYALVVGLAVPSATIDIQALIATQVEVGTEIAVPVER